MSNLFSSETSAETAKATRQQAASARYVLMTARCWSSPGARAELNDGQYSHRNTVPTTMEKSVQTSMYNSIVLTYFLYWLLIDINTI